MIELADGPQQKGSQPQFAKHRLNHGRCDVRSISCDVIGLYQPVAEIILID